MGLGFTFVKFGGKENKATEGSRAEEPQRSVLSEGPTRCVLLLLLAQENQLRGLQSQLWTTAVPSSLLSHPSCPPPVLLLPRSLLAGERQTTERKSGRLLRPHSPTGTAAASADWGSSNSPSRRRLWGLWLGTSSFPPSQRGWLLPPHYSHHPQSQVQGGINLSKARAHSQMAGRSCERPHHLWGKAAAWSPVLGASILPPSWGAGEGAGGGARLLLPHSCSCGPGRSESRG